jgi:PBP1b-binding outer membrane lipoprotein LpoB
MKLTSLKYGQWAAIIASAGLLAGCASGVKNPSGIPVTEMKADERGFVAGPGIESQDIVAVTDYMARKILSTPQIANAKTPPYILLRPIENNTRFTINKDLFLKRVRAQLNSQAYGKVLFIDRAMLPELEHENELKRSGQVTTSSDPNVVEFRGADFFLTGELQGQSTHTSAGTGDYIMYTFRLVDPRTSVIIWEDMREIKKQSLEDAAYR